MEKRAIVAAVLMAAVFLVYQTFFFPEPPAPASKPPVETTSQPPTAPAPAAPATTPVAPARAAQAARPPQRLATVEAPLYRDVVSSEGGKIQELVLRYRGEKPMVIVGDLGPAGLQLAPDGNGPGEVVSMSFDRDALVLTDKVAELGLTGEAVGLKIRQTLRFQPDGYAIEAHVRVENPGAAPRTVALSLPWLTRQSWRTTPEKFQGQHPTEIAWSTQGIINRIDDLTAAHSVVTDGEWVALDSIWYISALVPKGPGFKLVVSTEGKLPEAKNGDTKPAGRATVAVKATPTIAPGQAWEGNVVFYAGPKEYDRLKALGLQDTINFGGFPLPRKWGGLPMEWLGVPILLLMNWTYRHVGNFGIAIILLTIVSKVLFYPLTVKSMRSMKAMQSLQPQVNALRSKYQKDPQTLQRETLALYRKHRVNPMGGCLPMIAQVPIFYALYLALSVSVELQGAPFLCFGRLFGLDLWICDLAAQDPTYVLPVLMGITMFVQQKLTPTMGDPRQAKMMLFMPVIFTFMFLNLPSGLVLYWTVSNVLQILQQKLMDRPARTRATREAKDAGRA
ncbi:MAG: membrane protein insertase YidC [Candidatus Rokuibacteriota bacterium]